MRINYDFEPVLYCFYRHLTHSPSVSAFHALKKEAKETLVRDVAVYLLSLFALRFSHAGSLYCAQGPSVQVGPLVTYPLFRALDGQVRFPQSAPLDLTQFRGPFTNTIDRLSSSLKAELHVIKHWRTELLQHLEGDEALLNLGERILKKVVQLFEVYSGELNIGTSSGDTATRPFSINLDDFRLANIMVHLI